MKRTRTQTYTHTNKNKTEFACQSRLSKCDRRKCYETGSPFGLRLAVRTQRRSCGSLSLVDPWLAYFGGDLGFLHSSKSFSRWTSMGQPGAEQNARSWQLSKLRLFGNGNDLPLPPLPGKCTQIHTQTGAAVTKKLLGQRNYLALVSTAENGKKS